MPDSFRSTPRSKGLASVAATLMVSLVLAAAVAIWMLRQGAIADTEDDNHRLGVVLAEQTARTLQAVDSVLQQTAEMVAASGATDAQSLHAKFGGVDVHGALSKRLIDLPQANSFVILDSTGHFVNDSAKWPVPDYTNSSRSYFDHFLTTDDAGPYISEPVVSRSFGFRTTVLARRISASDGAFLGVIMAPIRLDYFDTLFTQIGFTDGTVVALIRRDGQILIHFPAFDLKPGKHVAATPKWYETVAAGGGSYTSSGTATSYGPTFISVHPLQNYPIVVDVGRSQAAALARWQRQALALATGVLAAAACLTLLLRALTRQITVREAAQEQISRQVLAAKAGEAILANTLGHMNQGLIMVDADGNIALCNRRALEILDLPAAMMEARPSASDVLKYQMQQNDLSVASDPILDIATLMGNQSCYERRRPNGTVIEVRTAPLPEGGMVRTYTDITARAAAEAMLGLAASHDQLTGLANRNGFNARLEAAIAAARRENTELAVLCLDLDRFKAINDTLGHAAGDQLLIMVAQRMREIARGSDIVGRLGGDEFAIVLCGSNLTGAELVCQRLLDSVRLPFILGGETACVGVSIGIAVYPLDGGTAEQLLCNADTALYKAKADGRNGWCSYASEDGQREQLRMQLEQDLRNAIERKQMSLAYQPICDGATGQPVAFEALLRWTHPARGSVSPADFIPIAEQTGLIIPIGRWVIEVACAEAAAWAMPLRIAVNLSPAQFHDDNLLAFIQEVLSRTGLAPDRLDLEVTEGLLLEDVQEVVTTMQALREMGIRMVLDDFGTAHSNLSYLRGFPFDTVKIDRSFLRALSSDSQARALVEAMLAMARALGLEVIGEGVETAEQLALLTAMNCRWVQGYLLGRPAPSETTCELIWRMAAKHTRRENPNTGSPRPGSPDRHASASRTQTGVTAPA